MRLCQTYCFHYSDQGYQTMKNILVVDDTLMFRTIMKRYLSQLGFNVLELESGKNIIKLISHAAVEAIILDIMMDEQEGIETITQLNKLPMHPTIIAVSSESDYLDVATVLGAEAALTKPVSLEDLASVLYKLGITAE